MKISMYKNLHPIFNGSMYRLKKIFARDRLIDPRILSKENNYSSIFVYDTTA